MSSGIRSPMAGALPHAGPLWQASWLSPADLRARSVLSDALKNSPPPWNPHRIQLLTRLLEDWRCQLMALHAEILLRWTNGDTDLHSDSLTDLEPVLLKRALAQDIASSEQPLIGLLGEAEGIHSLIDAVLAPESGDRDSQPRSQAQAQAWQQCTLQLDIGALAEQLRGALQEAVKDSADVPEQLLQPLSEPTSQTGSENLLIGRVRSLRELTHSPFSDARHTPRRELPISGASSVSGMSGPLQALSSAAARLAAPSEIFDDPAQWGGTAPSTDNSVSLSRFPSSRFKHALHSDPVSAGSRDLPGDRPLTSAMPASRLRLSHVAGGGGGGVGGPATFGDWSGTGLSSSFAPLPAVPPSTSAARQSIPLSRHSGLVDTDTLPASTICQAGTLLTTAFCAGPCTIRPAVSASGSVFPRKSSQSGPGSATSSDQRSSALLPHAFAISNPQLPIAMQRSAGQPLSIPPRPVGLESLHEAENPAPVVGTMDLDAALETLIHYESAIEGQSVSAARAAAAQSTLQQHVAAAVRAAGQATGARSTAGLNSSVGALELNLRTARQNAADSASAAAAAGSGSGQAPAPFAGAGGGGMANSAPAASMSVLLQSNRDAQAAYMAGTMSQYPLQRSTSVLVDAGQRSAAADAGLVSAPATHLVFNPQVSLSAPRPSSEWPRSSYRDGQVSHSGLAAVMQQQKMMQQQQQQQKVMQQQQQEVMMQQAHSTGQQVVLLSTGQPVALGGQTAWVAVPQPMAGANNTEAEDTFAPSSLPQQQRTLWPRLNRQIKSEVQQMLSHVPNLWGEDLDDPVLYQLILNRRSDPIADYNRSPAVDLPSPRLPRTHSMGGSGLSPNRCPLSRAILPTASKQALQRLPPRIVSRLEEVVARVDQLKWAHFDAGVIKVLCQLTEMSEADVLEELQLLENTDLTSVEYMPAYLNKRLNNRLWGRRKAQQQS